MSPLSSCPGLFLLFALAAPCVAVAQATAPTAPIGLQVREQREMRLPRDIERVAIADPDVADLVSAHGARGALLVGKRPGHTTLMLWQRGQSAPTRYRIEVQSPIQSELQEDGTRLTTQPDRALIAGSMPDMLAHERARQAAAAAAGDKATVVDASTVASGAVVQVDVKVVEFNKTALKQIGLNFLNRNNGFSYGMFGPSQLTSATATGSGMDVESKSPLGSAFNLIARSVTHDWFGDLSVLQSNGMARVLAEPTLVALSGQSASFLAGGELPIPEPQGLGTTAIVFKSFGIGLTVTPTVLGQDRIALKVAPEASDLDYTNALMFNGVQVPSITTRRADTTVELGDGESFVIGGLVSRTTTSMVNKVPLLGDIPIIGAFFRSLDYKHQDKELVIVVTPHLVHAIKRGAALPLPGQRQKDGHGPAWGAWLLGPASSDQLPGFSR
jgi:pilus assembly protein CpaC